MSITIPTKVIAFVVVGVMLALIGLVTFFSTRLVNRTVIDQFRSQELQLVSSLAQQTGTTFDGLKSDVISLSLQPAITDASAQSEAVALALLSDYASERAGIISSTVVFDPQGQPRYAWPAELQAAIKSGERLPYALPSRLTTQTAQGGYVPLDVELLIASHRDKPAGTFLLIAPVYDNQRDTGLIVNELNLDELFRQTMSFVDIGSNDQLWVLDSTSNILFQANPAVPLTSLLRSIPLASLASFRQPTLQEYRVGQADRLAVIAPIYAAGKTFLVILSRNYEAATARVESDLQLIFLLAAGTILLLSLLIWLGVRQLAQEVGRRQQEVQRRQTARALLEMARVLNSTLDLGDVLRSIMAELARIVKYDSAAILLLDRSKLLVAAYRGSSAVDHETIEIPLEQAKAANQVIQTGRSLVIPDTRLDERWTNVAPDSPIRSWMGIPMRVRDKTVGVLNINSHAVAAFSPEEVELAEAFADQAGVALQNARLHEYEVKQIEQDLSIASQIQNSLLPSAVPQIPQLELAALTIPARQVSGDYYQYLVLPQGALGVAVGDVSGKGIPAAMLMAVVTTALRDEVVRHPRAAALLNALNSRLLERMKTTHASSALLVGMFDPAAYQLELANAGMVQPYVRSDGDAKWDVVAVGGYPLGVSERMAYNPKTIHFPPGALLLAMSDGVVEAQNLSGEMYGFDRLESLLNGLPSDISAQALIDRILADVREYLGGEELQDDLTILALRARAV